MILSQDARRQINKALVPSEILEKGCAGELRAVFHPSSGILNIFPCDTHLSGRLFSRGAATIRNADKTTMVPTTFASS